MSITYNNSTSNSVNNTGTTIAVTDPGTAGDFLLAVWECDGVGQFCSPPDGTWIQLFTGTLTTDSATYFIWYKKTAVGSGTYTFTAGQSTNMGLVVVAWSGVNSTTPIQVTPVSETHDDGRASPANVIAPTVTTTADNCLIIWVGVGDSTTNSPATITFGAPSGYSSRVAFSDTSGWDIICIADKSQPTAGVVPAATGTFTRAATNFGVVGFHIPLADSGVNGAILRRNIGRFLTV